jgi:hypothetical protein
MSENFRGSIYGAARLAQASAEAQKAAVLFGGCSHHHHDMPYYWSQHSRFNIICVFFPLFAD